MAFFDSWTSSPHCIIAFCSWTAFSLKEYDSVGELFVAFAGPSSGFIGMLPLQSYDNPLLHYVIHIQFNMGSTLY